ncbi:TetR/AcrR family transcriptional regulator [Aquabacterium sp.]|uniref:TetR/AcrR family transcriptional regulator n=1 Tax=Aquabacterium sp. TaxID=1872578 RepID=UPI0035AE90AF
MPRKRAIIRTAQDLFSRHGYKAVTLREIAKEAGVSLTLVNHHFGSKLQLFEAIVKDWRAEVMANLHSVRDVPRQSSPEKGVAAVIEALLDYMDALRATPKGPQLVWVNIRNRHDDDADVHTLVRGLFNPVADCFVVSLGRQIPSASADELLALYQYIRGTLMEYLALPESGTPATDRTQLTRFLVGGIRSALAIDQTPQGPTCNQ